MKLCRNKTLQKYYKLLGLNNYITWIIIILFAIYFYYIYQDYYHNDGGCKEFLFDNFLDPWIGVGTFLMALVIGVQNNYEKWKDELPKRITVHFKYQNILVYTCYNAQLSAEGDIRPWAQQIGKQMNDNQLLEFYPFFDLEEKIAGNEYKHFEVTFYLTKRVNDNYKFWWDNDTQKSTRNREIICHKTIEKPFGKFIEIYEKQGIESFVQAYNNEYGILLTSNDIMERSIFDKQKIQDKGLSSTLLINLTNHPQKDWLTKQLEAGNKYKKIIDIVFPKIDPSASKYEIQCLAKDYLKKVLSYTQNDTPIEVHIQGEQTFCFELIRLLKEKNIKCIASTTQRFEDKSFDFVQFREY